MTRSVSRFLFVALVLGLPMLWIGCESGVDSTSAPDLSAETKTAAAVLPPDAAMTGMIDLQSVRERGPDAMRKMMSAPGMKGASESAARMRDFLASSGIDLERDLRRMYLAVQKMGEDGAPSFVVYGSFDQGRIEETLRSTFGNDLTQSVHDGTTIFTAAPNGAKSDRTMSVAVVNDEMIVGSASPQGIQAMLDRRGGEASDDELTRLASQGQSAWFVVRGIDAPGAKSGNGPSEIARLGRAVRDVAGSMSFTADGGLDGQMWMVPKEGASASDVADVARGGLAAVKQEAAQRDGAKADQVRRALDAVSITSDDRRVSVTFTLPATLVNDMSDAAKG
jgi:hypothetical protein